jgi:hypothetical protein
MSAAFKNGLLTVTMPKAPQAQSKVKRIAINRQMSEAEARAPARRPRNGFTQRRFTMAKRMLLLCFVSLCAILMDIQAVQAQPSLPDLSGTYRCVLDTRPCRSSPLSRFRSQAANWT